MPRSGALALLAILLSACAAPAAPPPQAPPTAQITRIAIASATSPPTATFTAEEARRERFLPLLLTLDDFADGVSYGEAPLTDSTTRAIQSLNAFSDAVGYTFTHPGSDFLGGLTGFLETEALQDEFDANMDANLQLLLEGFLAGVLDEDQPASNEEEQAAAAIDQDALPADVYWISEFGYSNGQLVRLDALGFRQGRVGVYLIYVSVPAKDPLIDIAATISLLGERIRASQADEF